MEENPTELLCEKELSHCPLKVQSDMGLFFSYTISAAPCFLWIHVALLQSFDHITRFLSYFQWRQTFLLIIHQWSVKMEDLSLWCSSF